LITNCGKAHLEGFGSEEGVRKAKGELFDHLRTLSNAVAFVNWDYDYLQQMSKGINSIIKYGTHAETAITGAVSKNDPLLEVEIINGITEKIITTNLVGEYNLPNVLAAVAVGNYFNIDSKKIKLAIENYHPSNSRSQLLQQGSNRIILDAYNANPASLKLAIENLAAIPGENKVLMLGGMAELGKDSIMEHEKIIELIDQYSWKAVVLVGGDFLKIDHPYFKFDNSLVAKEWLQQQHFENAIILIKGSRSIQMEKVLASPSLNER
ncbi:MAG: Mur ligase family protein, partial [Bacteroidota bacterium]